MGSVAIRIEPQQEPGKTDLLDVHLIEEDVNQTPGLFTRAGLTTGRWTANLDAASPPPASDIITLTSYASRSPGLKNAPVRPPPSGMGNNDRPVSGSRG